MIPLYHVTLNNANSPPSPLQSFVGAGMMLEVFIAVGLMPLGEVMTIIFSSPLFTAVGMRIFRGNRLRLWKSLFIGALLAGIILVMQPPIIFGKREEDDDDGIPRKRMQFSLF